MVTILAVRIRFKVLPPGSVIELSAAGMTRRPGQGDEFLSYGMKDRPFRGDVFCETENRGHAVSFPGLPDTLRRTRLDPIFGGDGYYEGFSVDTSSQRREEPIHSSIARIRLLRIDDEIPENS